MRTTPSRFSAFIGESGAAGPPSAPLAGSALERGYPAVVRAITLLWGYPELNQYFQKIAAGSDPQLNLEPDAMAEAMLLAAIHRQVCAAMPAQSVEDLYGPGRWADPWKTARTRR